MKDKTLKKILYISGAWCLLYATFGSGWVPWFAMIAAVFAGMSAIKDVSAWAKARDVSRSISDKIELGTLYRCRKYTELNYFLLDGQEFGDLSNDERDDIVEYRCFFYCYETADGEVIGEAKSPCDGMLHREVVRPW